MEGAESPYICLKMQGVKLKGCQKKTPSKILLKQLHLKTTYIIIFLFYCLQMFVS